MFTDKKNSAIVEQIFRDIRSGKDGRDRVITELYKNQKLRSGIKSTIFKMGGTEENFKDIFPITLMKFVKAVIQKPDLIISYELNTYISGIAKYTYLDTIRKEKKHSYVDHSDKEDEMVESPEELILNKDKMHLLNEILMKLGKNCKEVLMYWANGYKMKEIATLMDYKSDNMAKKKKYQCFKTLLLYIEDNPQIKSALR